MNGYAVGIQNGFMCPNDVRSLENMDLIPDELGGNKFMCNGNMIDIASVGRQYEKEEDDEEVLEVEESDRTDGEQTDDGENALPKRHDSRGKLVR